MSDNLGMEGGLIGKSLEKLGVLGVFCMLTVVVIASVVSA